MTIANEEIPDNLAANTTEPSQEVHNIVSDLEVEQFLGSLKKIVKGREKQYDRLVQVLWYCYLSLSYQPTELEVAEMLGVSNTTVSYDRKRIENALRLLSFTHIEEARSFETTLREKVRKIVEIDKEKEGI